MLKNKKISLFIDEYLYERIDRYAKKWEKSVEYMDEKVYKHMEGYVKSPPMTFERMLENFIRLGMEKHEKMHIGKYTID